MIVVQETCWLSAEQVLELLRTGELKLQSNDHSEVKLYVQYIDRIRAKETAEAIENIPILGYERVVYPEGKS